MSLGQLVQHCDIVGRALSDVASALDISMVEVNIRQEMAGGMNNDG